MTRSVLFFMLVAFPLLARGSRCEVWEDEQRIPHVRFESARDQSYCFGYLHGRDRAWMMDHLRRTAYGKNAEVHGFAHLKADMMMRLLDAPHWASRLYDTLGEKEKEWLRAYAAGVNHGFRVALQQPSEEFQKGHPAPQPWKPVHSLALLLLQSFDQTRKTFYTEWEETRAEEKWGAEAMALFDPDGLPWDTTILKPHEYRLALPASSAGPRSSRRAPRWQGPWPFPLLFGEAAGSNNWVVSGKFTRSGKAMLANDPHLDLKTPMFWHWVHLEGAGFDVIGASLPGVPLIVSGTNRQVSWGLTNAYLNAADAHFLSAEEDKELETFWPTVWVKWGALKLPIFVKSFRRTKERYPVLPLETEDGRAIMLKWTGFHLTGEDIAPLAEMMRAKSAKEMDQLLSRVGVPSWNFVFADRQGSIGFRVVGKTLKSTAKHELGIRAGDLATVRAPQLLAPEERPQSMNPARGWVVTANNRHWPADAQLYGGRSYTPGFRATRIEELVANKLHDLESFRRIQCDDQAVDARYFVPHIVRTLKEQALSPAERQALEELERWDLRASTECLACGPYRRTMDLLFEKLLVYEAGLWRLAEKSDARWSKALKEAWPVAVKESAGRSWGEMHKNPFGHLSQRSDWVFSPEVATRGDKHSVDPGVSRWNAERKVYEHYSGASERLVVVMQDTPEVHLILPGLNTRYTQHQGQKPWQEWASCELKRVNWPLEWSGKVLEKVEVEL